MPEIEPAIQSNGSSTIMFDNTIFGKYELGRLLGCGAFAKVYHARNVKTGQSVAVKVIGKKKIAGSNLMSNIKREITIMRCLRHPNIVRLHEVLATRTKIYFVMDIAKGGELFAKVAKGRFAVLTLSSNQLTLTPQISSPSPSTTSHLYLYRPPLYPCFLKFQTRCFSIHGVSPLLEYPPSPVTSAENSDYVTEFLVNSLGFSRAEAVAISAKVSPFKSKRRPFLVAHFFKQMGFDETQIRMLVSSVPKILGSSVEKNLRPKLAVFVEIGVSGSDLVKFISNNPQIIEASLNATILPNLELMRSVFASDEENMVRAIKRGVWILNSTTYARRNIELLRSYGVSEQRIQRFLLKFPKTLYGKPEWLQDVVVRVEEELGIPRQAAMFMYGVDTLAAMSKRTLESKYAIFKSYGWSQSDVLRLGRKLPSCLRISDTKIRTRLDYFMKELGFDSSYLVSHPVLLKLSLENRILPRNAVIRVLKENNVMEANLSFWTVMALTDAEFLRRFVLEYKDKFPDLCNVYFSDKVDFPLEGA